MQASSTTYDSCSNKANSATLLYYDARWRKVSNDWGPGGNLFLDVVITRGEGSLRTTFGQTQASTFSSALLSPGYWC